MHPPSSRRRPVAGGPCRTDHRIAPPGNGSAGHRTVLLTPHRLQAASLPSIRVDFAAAAEEDGAR